MHDAGKIVPGLVVFLVIVSFPVWYNLAGGQETALELEKPEGQCVEPADYMRSHHMRLLDVWRDEVVREGNRDYVSEAYGTTHEMSLTKTCLGCHTSRENFCSKCHDYMGESPYCFDCHVDPEEGP